MVGPFPFRLSGFFFGALIPIVISQSGEGYSYSDSANGMSVTEGDDPMEWIPLFIAFSSILVTGLFSTWVVIGVYCKKDDAILSSESVNVAYSRQQTTGKPEDALHVNSKQQPKRNPVLISWRGITCTYKVTENGGEDKTPLCNAYGEMRAGELTAVMGASGAGKSTLINILAGRKGLGTLRGEMSILGETVTDLSKALKLLQHSVAYVPQTEAFFPMQTRK